MEKLIWTFCPHCLITQYHEKEEKEWRCKNCKKINYLINQQYFKKEEE